MGEVIFYITAGKMRAETYLKIPAVSLEDFSITRSEFSTVSPKVGGFIKLRGLLRRAPLNISDKDISSSSVPP